MINKENCLIRVKNFVVNSFSLILKTYGVCCYYIVGGNIYFISYFNAKLVIFLVFLELFEKISLLIILSVIKNLSYIFFTFVSIYSFLVEVFLSFYGKISILDFHKSGSLVLFQYILDF